MKKEDFFSIDKDSFRAIIDARLALSKALTDDQTSLTEFISFKARQRYSKDAKLSPKKFSDAQKAGMEGAICSLTTFINTAISAYHDNQKSFSDPIVREICELYSCRASYERDREWEETLDIMINPKRIYDVVCFAQEFGGTEFHVRESEAEQLVQFLKKCGFNPDAAKRVRTIEHAPSR